MVSIRRYTMKVSLKRSGPCRCHQNKVILVQLMRKEHNIVLLDVLADEE